MKKTFKLASSLLTGVVLVAVNVGSSEAAPAWKCGKKHCFWTEGYTGPVPDFAANWGQPSGPGCYYVLRAKKKWVEYCPPTEPMQ